VGLSRDPQKRERQLANLRRGGPPAPLGNTRALKSGAWARISEAELQGKVREVFDALAADAPVREDGALPAADALVVRLLAENRVRRERVSASELRHGIENGDGSVRAVVHLGLRLDAQALDLARELAMTPRARVALGVDLVRAASADDRLREHLQRTYGNGNER
jgi:hypothetical protein